MIDSNLKGMKSWTRFIQNYCRQTCKNNNIEIRETGKLQYNTFDCVSCSTLDHIDLHLSHCETIKLETKDEIDLKNASITLTNQFRQSSVVDSLSLSLSLYENDKAICVVCGFYYVFDHKHQHFYRPPYT